MCLCALFLIMKSMSWNKLGFMVNNYNVKIPKQCFKYFSSIYYYLETMNFMVFLL